MGELEHILANGPVNISRRHFLQNLFDLFSLSFITPINSLSERVAQTQIFVMDSPYQSDLLQRYEKKIVIPYMQKIIFPKIERDIKRVPLEEWAKGISYFEDAHILFPLSLVGIHGDDEGNVQKILDSYQLVYHPVCEPKEIANQLTNSTKSKFVQTIVSSKRGYVPSETLYSILNYADIGGWEYLKIRLNRAKDYEPQFTLDKKSLQQKK